MTVQNLAALRAELLAIVERYPDPLDLITALSGVYAKYYPEYARKTGDYSTATTMSWTADELDAIEDRLDNRESSQETL